MRVNADFGARVVIRPDDAVWTPSPMAGVERCMLDRVGGEVARATSLVRYAPGSRFSAHEHGGGEEFLVLEGTFSDEHGDCGPGSYVRNPVGSRHSPRSDGGCTIFVKLRQMDPADQEGVRVDTRAGAWKPAPFEGAQMQPLHSFGREKVFLLRLPPHFRVPRHSHDGGEEILVLDGTLNYEHGAYPKGSWIRSPVGSSHQPWTDSGATLWIKWGHLPPA